MKNRRTVSTTGTCLTLTLLCAALPAPSVAAQSEGEAESSPTEVSAAQWQAAQEFLAATQPLPSNSSGPRVRPQFGISIDIPIWLDVDHEVVRPGATLELWASADLGYFVMGARMGFGWTPIDLKKSGDPELENQEQEPLHRLHFSPELRLQIPGKTLLPYLSSAFDVNWWNFSRRGEPGCSWDFCDRSRFTPGYTGRAGLGIHIVKAAYIDLGLAWTFTAKGDFFERRFWILSPFAGLLFRL